MKPAPINGLVPSHLVELPRCTPRQSRLELSRGLDTLTSTVYTSPWVGVFGTCIGIVNSFKGNTGRGTVAYDLMEAIVPTALSILIGLIAWLRHPYFTTQIESLDLANQCYR